MIKDYGLSIRTKLLNISKTEKQEYMKVLGRYFHERLLYRISISRYKSNLMLKGSSLLYAHYQFAARPTIDIDLLGQHIDEGIDHKVLREAIRNTFANRNTTYSEHKHLFDEDFANDANRNMRWKAFLKKLRLKEETTFPAVMTILRDNLQRYWNPESLDASDQ